MALTWGHPLLGQARGPDLISSDQSLPNPLIILFLSYQAHLIPRPGQTGSANMGARPAVPQAPVPAPGLKERFLAWRGLTLQAALPDAPGVPNGCSPASRPALGRADE